MDTSNSVQNIEGKWLNFDHTKNKLDKEPLECPKTSLKEVEKSVEIINNMTGRIDIYDTLDKALDELPKYGYGEKHWTQYFQNLLQQVARNINIPRHQG